ncbi:hypothetical protein LCGC14_1193940 [marine sediment metagenome]|uniref:Uncharacterized protein n=2 Tax=root TaxID=1 RepID=A0A831VR56_9FLAO|nr:hypothetical protein [Pricia sp.]HEA23611.1 hypothetical protein [Pricia antarctica]
MKSNTFKSIFLYGMLGLCFAFLASCDEEENLNTAKTLATCTDGMMNGDEIGIDCGGACGPCEEGMELGRRAELYVSNNANGDITKFSITGDSVITYTTASDEAEGIYFDIEQDLVVQASRSGLTLDAYKGLSMLTEDSDATSDFSGAADLESPREIAVSGDTYVVSDNGSNTYFVYTKSGDSFTLTSTVEIPFPVWGITFKGKDLYGVVDNTGDLAVFNNFEANAKDGVLIPSKRVTIGGIVRTHGLTYDGTDDVMIMTDIGDAANVTDDGGFHVIADFSRKFDALSDGEVLPASLQVRVAGPSTSMGNPIDVAYDSETDAVYISEVGNGKVLGFTAIGDGGDLTPTYTKDLMLASSIYFSSEETDGNIGNESVAQRTWLYATNNANGDINVYDSQAGLQKSVTSESNASEGIYYSALNDLVIQASRSNLRLENYSGFSGIPNGAVANPDFASSAGLVSPREIAVSGNRIVVSDNGENKFYIYCFDGFSFKLVSTLVTNCNLWGITFKGNDLLAVVDKSSDLAIYTDFIENNKTDGVVSPDKRITIEGIVRTHGIDYSEAADVLVMTDIGDADDANTDGGFQVIQNFNALLEATPNGSSIAQSQQIRISGPSTRLGNPIDVAYDHKTQTVYIAEVGNGKILGFSDVLNSNGNIVPTVHTDLTSASSIYLYNN